MLRKAVLYAVAAVLLLGLAAAGCGKKKEPPAQGQAKEEQEGPAAPAPSPGGGTGQAGESGGGTGRAGESGGGTGRADEGERWSPFGFRAGQYFKYALTVSEGGQTKKGWFSLELKPAGADQVEAIWQGELEGAKFSFRQTGPTETVTNPANIMITAAMSGPAAMPVLMAAGSTVFAPWYALAFADHPLAVGSGWEFSDQEGRSMSVKVVDRCREAGLAGSLVRLEAGDKEKKDEMVMESCVSPRSPLALSTRIWENKRLQYEAVLQEHRGL